MAENNADDRNAAVDVIVFWFAALGFGFGTGSIGVGVGVFLALIIITDAVENGAKIIAKAVSDKKN